MFCWCALAHLPKSVKHQHTSILIGRNRYMLTPISGAPASSCTIPATQPERLTIQLIEDCCPAHSGFSGVCSSAEAIVLLICGCSYIPVIKDFEYHPAYEYISLLRSIPSQGLGESRPQGDGQGAPTEVCLVSGLPASSGAHGQARPVIVELPDSKE